MIVHLTVGLRAHGKTPPRWLLERQCDELMTALVEMERFEPQVRDAAVSADFGQGRIEIEVESQADSYEEAAARARRRVEQAVEKTTGQKVEIHDRHSELVDA